MTLVVLAQEVRDYLKLEVNNPTGNSQYTDQTINSNTLAAQELLEQACNRWFVDRPTTTYSATTMFRPIVSLPGFRSFTDITFAGVSQDFTGSDATVWPLSDVQGSGLYLSLQFRTLRGSRGSIYADPLWWDKGYDVGLGHAYASGDTSQANDLVVSGAGGYAAGSEPYAFRHAVKVLSGFYTKRPDAILADVAITPAGGVLNYSSMPPEVTEFISRWRAGTQVVSV